MKKFIEKITNREKNQMRKTQKPNFALDLASDAKKYTAWSKESKRE